MVEDLLTAYISEGSANCKTALTDSSYRKKYQKEMKEANKGKPKKDRPHPDIEEDNFNMATLGDAVLRLSLTNILYQEKVRGISKRRADYESDEVLVTSIAAYYDIREHLLFDSEDENKIRYGYTYQGRQGNNNPQKFLATAMEALLGAYYLDHNESMKKINLVVKEWMKIIDKTEMTI